MIGSIMPRMTRSHSNGSGFYSIIPGWNTVSQQLNPRDPSIFTITNTMGWNRSGNINGSSAITDMTWLDGVQTINSFTTIQISSSGSSQNFSRTLTLTVSKPVGSTALNGGWEILTIVSPEFGTTVLNRTNGTFSGGNETSEAITWRWTLPSAIFTNNEIISFTFT